MSKTHWKKLGDPNFLGGYDFEEGEIKTLTIKAVENQEAFNPGDKKKENVRACVFKESVKPMILNATNSKMLSLLYKSNYVEDWIGRKFNVHFDTTVKVGRDIVGGLRILKILPKENRGSEYICLECKGVITGVGNMSAAQTADYTAKKYGRPLCGNCATKIASSVKNIDVLGDDAEKVEEDLPIGVETDVETSVTEQAEQIPTEQKNDIDNDETQTNEMEKEEVEDAHD